MEGTNLETDNKVYTEDHMEDVSITGISDAKIKADFTLTPLKEIYAEYFLIGNIFSAPDLSGVRFDLLKHHFNVLTPENTMKPEAMMDNDTGEYRFTAVDKMLTTLSAANFKIIGHTLGWHNQSPPRLNEKEKEPLTKEEAEINLKNYVAAVAGNYKGKLLSWDVLNEIMADNPTNPSDWKDSLRKSSPWYKAFANGGEGSDYIELIFLEARKADPNAIRYYNDYNLDNQAKATAVANMVKEINDKFLAENPKEERLLIEGVGMQGHYNLNTSIKNVENSIKRFKEIGVEVCITELDITVAKTGEITEENEGRQAAKYAELFIVFKNNADVIKRVTFWGLEDALSWRSTQFPVLFNKDLSAKQAYYAAANPESFLKNYIPPAREPVMQGTAVYGTPAMDGTIDPVWKNAEALPINKMLQAWEYPSGTARVLWDEGNLYVLVEVKNVELDNRSENPHDQDSVEVFVDERNCKDGPYDVDDGQYRVCYDGMESFGGSTKKEGFQSTATVNGTNYIIKMKIPFKYVTPEVGTKVGFDVQINYAKNGVREGAAIWCDDSGDSWENTSKWGELTLEN